MASKTKIKNKDASPQLTEKRRKHAIVDVEEEKVKLIIFSLMEDYYAIYGNDVREILPVGEIIYVPGLPDFILGIINVRGEVESVLNIKKFVGVPDTKINSKSRIAIAAKGDIRSGILVDSIVDVIDVPKSSIKPPITTFNQSIKDLVAGSTTYHSKNTILLDIGKLFARITKNRTKLI